MMTVILQIQKEVNIHLMESFEEKKIAQFSVWYTILEFQEAVSPNSNTRHQIGKSMYQKKQNVTQLIPM